MRHKHQYFRMAALALLTALPAICANGQTVTGKIVDSEGKPLPLANIVALSLPDSAFVGGAVSKADGSFSLDAQGRAGLLRITSMGCKTVYKYVRGDMGMITLEQEAQRLGETVVTSKLPKTRLRNGAMVTTITGTALENAGTAEALLDRLPGVAAKRGKIEVLGRGAPVIYINGRRMRDRTELDALSSDNIRSVEVITSPGARYESSITSVIRITTKKPAGEGFGLDSRTTAQYAEKGDMGCKESLRLSYRKGRLDMQGTLYGSRGDSRDDKNLEQLAYLDKTWRQQNRLMQQKKTTNLYAKATVSCQLNTASSIGASLSYDRYPEQTWFSKMQTSVFQDDMLTETSTSDSEIKDRETKLYANAYYVGKAGRLGIDLNADWYRTFENRPQDIQELYTETGQAEQQTNVSTRQKTRSSLAAAKLVLTYPVMGGELGIGGELSGSRRKNTYAALPAGLIDDDDSRIEEDMQSAFIDYTRQFGRLSVQAGLRYEHVGFDYYEQNVLMAGQSREYSNWLPSVSVSAPIGRAEVQLAYASDISRPSYWSLRGGTEYINRYTLQSGNPFLLPTITRNLSCGLSYKWIMLTAVFSHISDPVFTYGKTYQSQPEVMRLTSRNADPYNSLNATLSLSPKFGKWQPALRASLSKQWLDMDTHDGKALRRPQATFRLDNTLSSRLCDITLMATAATTGASGNMLQAKGSFSADLMLHKSLSGGKLTLQLYITDLLGTGDTHYNGYFGKPRTLRYNGISRTTAQLTARLRLNAAKSKYKGTGAGESQRGRM